MICSRSARRALCARDSTDTTLGKVQTCHDGRSMRRSRAVIDVVLENGPVKFRDSLLRPEADLISVRATPDDGLAAGKSAGLMALFRDPDRADEGCRRHRAGGQR